MFKLFYNAKIHTFNNDVPTCSAILIQNNRIVFCGDEDDISLPESQLKKINLSGLSVLPSFIDCHTHFAMASKKTDQISLDHCQTFKETLQEIKNNVKRFQKGKWIKGSGWNANLWDGIVPNKKHLDSITTEYPIALFSKDLHAMWLNSLALNKCGFDSNVSPELNSKIYVDDNGTLTGIIVEDACGIVEEISSTISSNRDEQNLKQYSKELLEAGITSVHSMENLDDFEMFMKLHRNKELKTRICFHPPAEEVETIIKSRIYSGFGNEWLRYGGLKYFVDGSLGSQTADMFENYDGLGHAGIGILSQNELTKQLKYAASNGLGATIHAIGDKANHKTLNAIEETINQSSSPIPLRHRIEHCQIINESDIERFSKSKIIASMQPLHIADDVKISDKYLGQRAKNGYPINSLLKSGTKVVFGSDNPVANFNPFKGMLAAISRRYNLDSNEESWYPEQNLTIQEALKSYTKDAAFASYEESIKGTLEPGKLADFVILSDDLLNSKNPEESLKKVEVAATVLDGNIVFRNEKSEF
jgi:predicted amidohydrolase YtcJ